MIRRIYAALRARFYAWYYQRCPDRDPLRAEKDRQVDPRPASSINYHVPFYVLPAMLEGHLAGLKAKHGMQRLKVMQQQEAQRQIRHAFLFDGKRIEVTLDEREPSGTAERLIAEHIALMERYRAHRVEPHGYIHARGPYDD